MAHVIICLELLRRKYQIPKVTQAILNEKKIVVCIKKNILLSVRKEAHQQMIDSVQLYIPRNFTDIIHV